MTADTTVAEPANELRAAFSSDAAFGEWYERTFPRVHGYVSGRVAGDLALAEDITQQTYIAAIAQRAAFDGRSDSVTWLCAIARHKLMDHFRRQDREERRHHRIVVHEIRVEEQGQSAAWSSAEEQELIASALRSLPALQRAVITLVALDGLSVAEAAAFIGKSHGATQSLLARARDGFRRTWASEVADV
ncbi:MAG TPA: RNA polymerase sigma factor [Candidatus Limnocylindrales bacterium]|nr:RNA polymerase sigma factor [Candidatus Limnocylindrales bacterium]